MTVQHNKATLASCAADVARVAVQSVKEDVSFVQQQLNDAIAAAVAAQMAAGRRERLLQIDIENLQANVAALTSERDTIGRERVVTIIEKGGLQFLRHDSWQEHHSTVIGDNTQVKRASALVLMQSMLDRTKMQHTNKSQTCAGLVTLMWLFKAVSDVLSLQ